MQGYCPEHDGTFYGNEVRHNWKKQSCSISPVFEQMKHEAHLLGKDLFNFVILVLSEGLIFLFSKEISSPPQLLNTIRENPSKSPMVLKWNIHSLTVYVFQMFWGRFYNFVVNENL